MAKFIIHRLNKLSQIKNLKPTDSFECDVINFNKNLVMQHDINKKGCSFFDFIKKINNKQTVFLNVKSYGIINKIYKKIKNKNIFLLDLSFSEINFLILKKFTRLIILRYSIYENLDLNQKYFKEIQWIWVDYFQNRKIDYKTYKYIKKFNKKICIVSPELLGKKEDDIKKYAKYLNKNKIKVDAICTKNKFIKIWKKFYNY